MLSQVSKDTIRLAIHLAVQPSNEYIRIRRIAGEIGMSYYSLAKVAQNLARAGVLDSYSGPNGGFRLKESPHNIYLPNMLEAVDGSHNINSCVLGFGLCGEGNPCPLHDHLKVAREEIMKVFAEKTLAELIGLDDQISQDI